MNAAEAMISLGGDIKPYQAALKQAEGETAATGSRLGKLLSPGNLLKGIGVAASAGLGLATKQMLDLQNATSKLRAETGMTAEAAEKAGKAINRMSGENLQSVAQIGDAYSKVVTDLGLTGEAADAATQQFLRFSTATGQDAAGAVMAFDDILDAWGLTAEDAGGIMDQLVVSHQKFGGSIEGNQAALATLAPSLKAMNMELDDGVEFLNLAASSGIDAASAAAGLNKAVKTLKPGQDLDDLVAQLGAIEDPTLRAQAGIELFGKSGAKLANAIKPGITSLDEYAVSAEESVGATENAADAMESTFGAQAQLLIKKFGSTVAEVMGPAGPILTGFASLATLGGSLGFDKLLAKAAASGPVKTAAAAAGKAIGGMVSAAMWLLSTTASLAAAGLSALAGSSVVQGAATRAGTLMGGKIGAGIGLGLVGAAAVIADQVGPEIMRAGNDLGMQIPFLLKERMELGEWLRELPWPLGPGKKNQIDAAVNANLQALNQQLVAGGKEAGEAGGTETARAFGGGWAASGIFVDMGAQAKLRAEGIIEQFGMAFAVLPEKVAGPAKAAGERMPLAIAEGIVSKREAPMNAFDQLVEMLKTPLSRTAEVAKNLGILASKELAAGLRSNDPAIREQARGVVEVVLKNLEDLKLRPGIISEAGMKSLIAGMNSSNKEIRTAAMGVYETVRDNLPQSGPMSKWGKDAGAAYTAALVGQLKAAQTPLDAELYAIRSKFGPTSSPPKPPAILAGIDKWGKDTGLAWVDAFIEALGTAEELTKKKLAGVKAEFDKFIKNYQGIGGLFPAAGPEETRERLEQYIKNLNKQLTLTTEPAERLAILSQIADYTQRLADTQGKVSTETQKDIATLQGYLANIDKALLTEDDPKKRAALTAQWVVYYQRLEKLRNPEEPNVIDTVENGRRLKEIEIDLKRIELEREKSALSMTEESEEQNKERIKAIDHELDLLDNQQQAIDHEREIRDLLIEQNKIRKEMGLAPLPIPGEAPAPAAPGAPVTTEPSGLLPGGPASNAPAGMTPEREAALRAANAQDDATIKELEATKNRTAAQQKTLNETYARREKNLRELGVIAANQPVGISYGPGYTGARQHGGPVAAGRPYLVGERGPEVFVPEIAGRILSSPIARRMMAGAWAGINEAAKCLEITVNNYNAVPKTGQDSTEQSLRTLAAVGVI